MSEMSQVTDLLTRTDQDFEHTQHRSHRTKITLYVILGPLYILTLGIAVSMLIRLWQGEDSLQFWAAFASQFPFAMSTVQMYLAFASDSRTPLFAPIAALRASIRAGDTTLAPIVPDAAAPALDLSAPTTARIGPLHRPIKWSNPFLVLALIVLVVAVVGVPTTLAYVSVQAGMSLGVALLALLTTSSLLAYRAVGPVHVRVDAEGLRWPRLFGAHHRLLWHDAQALIQLGDARLFLDDRKTTYILYGPARVFTWNITGSARRQRERAATQSLLSTISRRTGLPLRDVSTEARRIAYQLADPLIAHKLTPQERNYRFRVAGIVLLPFIIIALFAGTVQITQPWYFEHLYMRALTSTPLYADPLTHKDSDWPETDSARFANGAYTITHDLELFGFHPTLIPSRHHYGYALYEVTARTYSDDPQINLEGAGLAIPSRDISQPMLAFYAAPNGEWWLEQVTFSGQSDHLLFRIGDSTAIHPGFGVPNRIAILVQGSDFTFYVNVHYITRYHDDHLAGDFTGLYLNAAAQHGSFTDFAIYPA